MKQVRRWQRILILSLLSVSVFAPIVFVSNRLKGITSVGRKEFVEELSNIRYRTNDLRLNAIEQQEGEGLKEPKPVLYQDGDFNSVLSYSSSNESLDSNQSDIKGGVGFFLESDGAKLESNEENEKVSQKAGFRSDEKEQPKPTVFHLAKKEGFLPRKAGGEKNIRSPPKKATDETVKEIRDKIIQAKAYLNSAPPGSNSQIVKELRTRMKELERAVGDATKDSDLSRSALHKMKPMEASLFKASRVFSDCSSIATKLRAMTYNTEEQVRTQKIQATYLVQLAARTTPKGLHCLSIRLTSEFFALDPEKRQLPNQQNVNDPSLRHYAVFSDNVLACAVVVNSTVLAAKEPERIVFHVVTDSLNLPAITMWFLINPPGRATIDIKNKDSWDWLSSDYTSLLMKRNLHDPRFTSSLNDLRFYLPDIFPDLNKIVLFDHDIVVRKDLSKLWSVGMRGKVVGAVETCVEGEPLFRRMDSFINFSDSWVAKKFDAKTCTWAFAMNLFDLNEWRRRNLSSVYQKYLQMGFKRALWKAGTLPIGWLTFYNQTVPLNKRWLVLGLGYESEVSQDQIEQAAILHYDGIMKPWLEIGVAKYKSYWTRHVPFDHPYLQQCNIQD